MQEEPKPLGLPFDWHRASHRPAQLVRSVALLARAAARLRRSASQPAEQARAALPARFSEEEHVGGNAAFDEVWNKGDHRTPGRDLVADGSLPDGAVLLAHTKSQPDIDG